MILWDLASVETRGLGRSPILGGLGGAEPPQPKQIITVFVYFEIVSFTTSDVFWIACLSCLFFLYVQSSVSYRTLSIVFLSDCSYCFIVNVITLRGTRDRVYKYIHACIFSPRKTKLHSRQSYWRIHCKPKALLIYLSCAEVCLTSRNFRKQMILRALNVSILRFFYFKNQQALPK